MSSTGNRATTGGPEKSRATTGGTERQYRATTGRQAENRKLTKRSRRIVQAVFLFMLVITAIVTYLRYANDKEAKWHRTELNARITADRIEEDLRRGITITDALERIIIDNSGEIHDFEAAAEDMMADYIGSIQLAPAGKVNAIYPLEGNEAGMIDLFDDEIRGKVCRYAVEHDTVTMQGPFDLKQGGQGIAVRNPIFLTGKGGEKEFWGFSIVIIKVPKIYQHTIEELGSFDFDYCLHATVLPLTDEPKRIAASIDEEVSLGNAAKETFEIGGCVWTLEISPKQHHGADGYQLVLLGMLFLTAMITFMAYQTEMTRQLHAQLQKLFEAEKYASEHDPLTGLYNRRMYSDLLHEIKRGEHKSAYIINMDVNGLKTVNDTLGHKEGDALIIAAAKAITDTFGDIATVFRTGGDEFEAIILDKEVDAEKLRAALEEHTKAWKGSFGEELAISVGIAGSTQENPMTVEEMLEKADSEMYTNKRLYYSQKGNDRRN